MRFIRYALATICFAASVSCLGLWGWSISHRDRNLGVSWYSSSCVFHISFDCGETVAQFMSKDGQMMADPRMRGFRFRSNIVSPAISGAYFVKSPAPSFSIEHNRLYFPLWYPALIFALAGVGVLRVSRRFSIRSGLICVSVIAVLLGMAVIL